MSSISSAGSSLYSYLQSLNKTQSTSQTDPSQTDPTSTANANGVNVTAPTTTTNSPQPTEGAHRHHHHHGGGGGGNDGDLQKLQSAVTSALQSAQSSGSTTDPNQVIEDAISKVFQNSNAAAAPAASSDSSTSSPATASTPNSAQQSFLDTLKSYGVSADQFRTDFLSAIKQAQSGNANTSAAFQSFPPGTAVDTVA